MELNSNQIQEINPHRYPFALVDRITDYKPGEYAVKDTSGKYVSIGTRQNANANGKVLDLKSGMISGVNVINNYDRYALAEDGLFINTLYR